MDNYFSHATHWLRPVEFKGFLVEELRKSPRSDLIHLRATFDSLGKAPPPSTFYLHCSHALQQENKLDFQSSRLLRASRCSYRFANSIVGVLGELETEKFLAPFRFVYQNVARLPEPSDEMSARP